MFAGARLRRLRDDRGLSQAGLARRIDLSTSYVNQLENDQRPLTVPVLLALTREFDLPPDFFAADGDVRLVGDLVDVFAAGETEVSRAELSELAARMPGVGATLVNLHRRLTATTTELENLRGGLSVDPSASGTHRTDPMPFEEVRDYFYDRRNHIDELDRAAEEVFDANALSIGGLDLQLSELLERDHGIRMVLVGEPEEGATTVPKRRYDPNERIVYLARRLTAGQRAFQLATQLALLTQRELLDQLLAGAENLSAASVPVARIGLANYFAGALLLPYQRFQAAARRLRYDIDLLSLRFEVGFETVCHRLSTLQRPGSRGIPFIFVRVDQAGNISKRQSATAFHFSRVGGNCPLWVVHNAFASPGRILTQVSEMPDGRQYFWLARTTEETPHGFLGPQRSFAIGLGCDLAHAEELIYATGLNLDGPGVPIGAGCKVCDRPACPQRAFPQLGRPLALDETRSEAIPYRPA